MIRSPIGWFVCVLLASACAANLLRLGIDPFSVDVWGDLYSLALTEPVTMLTVVFTRNPIGNPITSWLIFSVFGLLVVLSSITGVAGFLADRIRISRMRKGGRRPLAAKFASGDGGKKISGGTSISLVDDRATGGGAVVLDDFSATVEETVRRKKVRLPRPPLRVPRFGFAQLRKWARSRVTNIKDMKAARSSKNDEYEAEAMIDSEPQSASIPPSRNAPSVSIFAKIGALGSLIAARLDSNGLEKKRAMLTADAAAEVRRKERDKRAEKAALFWDWVDDLKSADGIEEKIVLAARAAALADMLSAEDRSEIVEMRPVSGDVSMKMLESWSSKKLELGGAAISSREDEARAFRERLGRKAADVAVQNEERDMIDRAAMAVMSGDRSGEFSVRDVSASASVASSIAGEFADDDWREEGDEAVAAEIDNDIEALLRERDGEVADDVEGDDLAATSPGDSAADSWSSGVEDDDGDAHFLVQEGADDVSDEIADDMVAEAPSDQIVASSSSLAGETAANDGDPIADLRAEMAVVERFMKFRRVMKLAEAEAGFDVEELRDWDASTADRIEGALMAMLRVDEETVRAISIEDGFDETTVDGFLGLHADLVENADSVFGSIRNTGGGHDGGDNDGDIDGDVVGGVQPGPSEDGVDFENVSWDEIQRIRTEGEATAPQPGSDGADEEPGVGDTGDAEEVIGEVGDEREHLDGDTLINADADPDGVSAPVEVVTETVDWRKQYARATSLCDALEAMVAGPVAADLTQLEKVLLPGGGEQLAHVFFRIGGRAVVAIFLELDGDEWSMSGGDGALVSASLGRRILIPAISTSASGEPVSLFVIVHGSGSGGLERIARVGDTRVVRWPSDDGMITTVMGL